MAAVRFAHTADWHFGHTRVPTQDTISDIKEHLFPRLRDIDILFIAGDVFDGKISFNDHNASLIIAFFTELFKECFLHHVTVRIVRGTYTHDLLQNGVIDKIHKHLGLAVNFRLINEICIEHLADHGFDVLYIPDNLPFRNKSEVFDHIRMLLTANNLTAVDYVVMHGEFDHCGFGVHNQNAYTALDFKEICRKLVLSGHIHKPQQYQHVIYAGSFNRLAHNEEEDKGFWLIDDNKATFVVNKTATKFVTVDYSKEPDLDRIMEKHDRLMEDFPSERQGFIRALIGDANLKQAILNYHNEKYANVKLTFKPTHYQTDINSFIWDKLKRVQGEVLEVPSLKNVARIVCNHLKSQGIDMDVAIVEEIINGS